jgi:alkylation response protein AidB-like acyl-CoA dehydrogenase|tara:strand:- start:3226 stop:4395 length:1170 start_codon:yes stop_codon:yes gene_type:complete
MNFKFTDEQMMIRDTAEAFLAQTSTSAAVRQAMGTELGYDHQLWRRICDEMCWQGMHIPEAYGGLGLGYVELVATLEQMGRYLCCSPFYASVCLAANALLVTGTEHQKLTYLPQIAVGKTATLAYTGESGGWDSNSVKVTYQKQGDSYRLNGSYRFVPDGHSAEILVLAARDQDTQGDEGISLFVVPANTPGIRREWLPTMDQTRRQGQLQLDDLVLNSDAVMGDVGQSWTQLEQILDLGRIAVAAEQLGGSQKCLDSTVAYISERVQFGRSIASYQSVKHKCADMMVKVEASRSAVYYAACVGDQFFNQTSDAVGLAEAASIAKAYSSEGFFHNAGVGIQLHGGVGITSEYDIQLYFKRAKSTETFLGAADYHRERLATLLLDTQVAL